MNERIFDWWCVDAELNVLAHGTINASETKMGDYRAANEETATIIAQSGLAVAIVYMDHEQRSLAYSGTTCGVVIRLPAPYELERDNVVHLTHHLFKMQPSDVFS